MRCKILNLSLAAFSFAVVQTASAADMSPPVPAYKAPALVAVAPDWTGFYVGVGVGARWTNIDGEVTAATNNGVNIFCTPSTSGPCLGTSLSDTAFRVAGHLGYNWQVAPAWVLGVEGDFGWADSKSTLANAVYPGGNFPFYLTGRSDDSFSVKTTWDGSARLRAGYLLMPNLLLYATGGGAWLHVETNSTCGSQSFCNPPNVNGFAPASISNSKTLGGWTVGGGGETMLTPNWLLRAEYRYSDYGTYSNTETRVCPPAGCGGAGTTQVASYDLRIKTSTAMVGVSYKFGGH